MLTVESLNPKFVTDAQGEKSAVILPIAQYGELVELLEDLQDLAIIAEEKNAPTRSHEEVVKALKASGYLQD